MPSVLNKSYHQPWPVGEALYSGGTKVQRLRSGYRSLPGESPTQVLPYTGRTAYGSCLRYLPYPGSPTNAFGPPEPFGSAVPYVSTYGQLSNQRRAAVRNKAYAKFKDVAIGESSQMGTFIAEGRESFGMIANRATGLYRAYRELKRGNFRRFLRELSVKPKRKHRSVARTAAGEASGLWLEYWFGWSPTVQDIFNAYEVLTREGGYQRYSGSSGAVLPKTENRYGSGSRERGIVSAHGKYYAKTGATLRLENPNAALRSSLGLNNPLAIAWELVPFSFVVDWFTQLGNFINAHTDFAGFSLHDAYDTEFQRCYVHWKKWNDTYGGSGYGGTYEMSVYQQTRRTGLIQPTILRPRIANFGSSVTRAATAVSLLNAIFLDR